ncbi:hypothetical protein KNV09_gp157 [Vibrio phage Athena]|uniref:Uncharacterized protein n=11 Tax=Thalassavirus TaxID=2948922 RepID=A0A6M4ETA5_9CAUD|nr:hypothetical protein FDJ20_gp164 [Vibrio phage Thalassa]YP_010101911.1 hypothetical protein KNU52_gp141 [Vibrio phage Achelous]YP_010102566.1 hypothetical protein KNU58_gp139 [Vibrio phage Brizo]YP_010102748.1 hypothetical protein KNU59_gp152 [Vibrio phage Pontus]YP_010105726.1 hypothetical protein KNU87_gp153 [Vibrio phage Bennett]YP_010105917.1 hypothetical protein KNU88_gp155 [Vibrio phage Chester]YP_010108175.1 hypothetical protein KNV06_gp154 [Vibrio phage AG74]YP_010108365.1 hypothe
MAKEEFEKPANDYDKPELVYAVTLLLNLHDMPQEVNKLSKKALWRIYDAFQERGNAFANIEDDLRKAERERNEWQTRAVVAERKVKKMEGARHGKRTKPRK